VQEDRFSTSQAKEAAPSAWSRDRLRAAGQLTFISYSHHDRTVANKLSSALHAKGIDVTIDDLSMSPGQSIPDFVEEIRHVDAMLLIVSKDSLISSWVGKEIMTVLSSKNVFIACYIDDEFLKDTFCVEAVKRIDNRINELVEISQQQIQLGVGTDDKNSEIARLRALRIDLPAILDKLKQRRVEDIRDPVFDESVAKLVNTIHTMQTTSAMTLRPVQAVPKDQDPEVAPNQEVWT
jgi:hypothetical protein